VVLKLGVVYKTIGGTIGHIKWMIFWLEQLPSTTYNFTNFGSCWMIFGAPKYLRSISGTWRLRKQAPPETSGDLCHQAPRPGRTGCGWKAMWLAAVFRVGEQFWTFILFYIDIY
jgi:hypothetical protein